MTTLPQHRHIVHGRTWGRSWSPADYDPIQVYRRPNTGINKAAGVVLAIVIGILGAASIVHWWAQ